eukprot:Skav211578  [mRNA]  locus=scaffold2913:21222:24772:+ [translate_table: standard]
MSLFWSQWKPQYWTKSTVEWLQKDWNITLIRAPMAIEAGGYLTNKQAEAKKMKTVVEAAIDAGIYVIIDWHDHNAEDHEEEAAQFFRKAAQKYGNVPNVIFEIYNEPIRQNWSLTIKPYHERIVSVIREHSSNLIVLGTRFWSQDVDEAAKDPVQGENLAYTIHFYANTHMQELPLAATARRQELRDKVTQAVESVAVFATAWGTCDASGDGTLNLQEAKTWLDFFKELKISHANWAVSDKQEACSALLPGASGEGGWRDCHLDCFQKNEYWATCKASCTPGIDPTDPPEYATPWTCKAAGVSQMYHFLPCLGHSFIVFHMLSPFSDSCSGIWVCVLFDADHMCRQIWLFSARRY